MQYKIKPKQVPNKKMKFLFFPRYCEGCLTCFWLEKIMFKGGCWWSPDGCPKCGRFLWCSKKDARFYHVENEQYQHPERI